MNKFFKSAVDRFNSLKGDKEFLINPISEIDSEIIVELSQILKKAGLKDVCELLKHHKEYKDEELRDSLLQWNIDNPKLNSQKDVDIQEEESLKYPPFVKIGELIVKIFDIHGLRVFEEFSKKEGDFVYCIELNPTPEDVKHVPLYANTKLVYADEDDRNRILSKLESFLAENGTESIDLNKDE